VGATGPGTRRWWPEVRPIDVIGLVLVAALAGWVGWASAERGADAIPFLTLFAVLVVVAALTRWATFFHGTAPAGLLAVTVAVYAIATGDAGPHRLGDEAADTAAGLLFVTGAGAAGIAAARLAPRGPRWAFGLLTVALAALTVSTGALGPAVLAGLVVVVVLAFLLGQIREPRWVVVWPAILAVFLLLGTISYGLLVPVGDEGFLRPDPELHERWSTAIDVASDHPVTGVGMGAVGRAEIPQAVTAGWARHEPLQFAAETGILGGALLLTLLGWSLVWIAQPGWRRGSSIAGLVVAGAVILACFQPVFRAPAVPIALAALLGTASLRGGAASWRLAGLWEHFTSVEERPPDPSTPPFGIPLVDEDGHPALGDGEEQQGARARTSDR
jgi:hypothetical protein